MIAIKKNISKENIKFDLKKFRYTVSGCYVSIMEWLDSYCRIKGWIEPLDSEAESIEFQVNLPYLWNEKMLHCGGAGFDGNLVTGEEQIVGEALDDKTPLEKGFVTYGSDGGHKEHKPWDSDWAVNDEMLRNFAHEQLKKTHDAAVQIIDVFYEKKARYSYFAGGSNGGREALKVTQNYPEDYDGIICFFPVLNWVEKACMDVRNSNYMQGMGTEGLITKEQFLACRKKILEIAANEDGIITNIDLNENVKSEIRSAVKDILSEKQVAVLDMFETPFAFEEPLANNINAMPPYYPYEGEPLVAEEELSELCQLSTHPDKRDGFMSLFGDAVLQYQVLRGKEAYNPVTFNISERYEELKTAAELLDATNPDIKKFHDKGGKFILMHGLADQLVTPMGSINYYKSLQERWNQDELDSFFRFYLLPGYGHGEGEDFKIGAPIMEMLDKWVTEGVAPEDFVAVDQLEGHNRRTMKIRRYDFL